MPDSYFTIPGQSVTPSELQVSKAADLAERLNAGQIPFAFLVDCKIGDLGESVIFDVRIEVPNRRVYPILRRERIAATFSPEDRSHPIVEALRKDFPQVPHLNLHIQEFPRYLCLYDESYEELKRRWTSMRFVHRIREWLEENAKGQLHQDDQYLEPLLLDYFGHIVLPSDFEKRPKEPLYLEGQISERSGKTFLRARRTPPQNADTAPPVVISPHICKPQTHGTLHRRPQTLEQLDGITHASGIDLIAELRTALLEWNPDALDSQVMLIVIFPKSRTPDGPIEEFDTWCLLTSANVRNLGKSLGVWDEAHGEMGIILGTQGGNRGADIEVLLLNPTSELTRDFAAQLSGDQQASDVTGTVVGVGALGSQVVMNFARSGFGQWSLIDPDILMPHNLTRHALNGLYLGFNKAEALAYSANNLTFGPNIFRGIDADIVNAGASEPLNDALQNAEIIVDITASVAAQRKIARDIQSHARRICAFLTPSGSDLIVFAEDPSRSVTLDGLEMQYYRATLENSQLAGHIDNPNRQYRYARSCGDISSAIAPDLVTLHAAISSRQIKDILAQDKPFIGVWRTDENRAVQFVPINPCNQIECNRETWTIVTDEGLLRQLFEIRERRLPTETGGILLGSFDLERKYIYIVATLPAPLDSLELRDLFIRGCKDLPKQLSKVEIKTGGMLEYIGEWHSHPSGANARPSNDDKALFDWLRELMAYDGLPPVMAIVGSSGEIRFFVDSISDDPSQIVNIANGSVLA